MDSNNHVMSRLLTALHYYEQVNGAETLPHVMLYSDGTGELRTMDAGTIYQFKTPTDACRWLEEAFEHSVYDAPVPAQPNVGEV